MQKEKTHCYEPKSGLDYQFAENCPHHPWAGESRPFCLAQSHCHFSPATATVDVVLLLIKPTFKANRNGNLLLHPEWQPSTASSHGGRRNVESDLKVDPSNTIRDSQEFLEKMARRNVTSNCTHLKETFALRHLPSLTQDQGWTAKQTINCSQDISLFLSSLSFI